MNADVEMWEPVAKAEESESRPVVVSDRATSDMRHSK